MHLLATMIKHARFSIGLFLVLAILSFAVMPVSARAALLPACNPIEGQGSADHVCGFGDLLQLAMNIYNVMIGLAALVALLFLVFGGIQMMYWSFLEDSASQLQAAKLTARRALGGFFIVLVAYVLVNTLILLLGGAGINEILSQLTRPSTNGLSESSSAPASNFGSNGPLSVAGLDVTNPNVVAAFTVLDSNADGEIIPIEESDTVPTIVRVLAAANTTPDNVEYDAEFDLNSNGVIESTEVDYFVHVYRQSQLALTVPDPAGAGSSESLIDFVPPSGLNESEEADNGGLSSVDDQLPFRWTRISEVRAQVADDSESLFTGSAWQNPVNNLDVNGDGSLSPLDLLILINRVSDGGFTSLKGPPPYYDVNADGSITTADSQLITKTLEGNSDTAKLVGDKSFWQNQLEALDVDASGHVVPLDALLIINQINKKGPGVLPVPPPYIDVNGDGSFSPIDFKLVSEAINGQNSAVSVPPESVGNFRSASASAFTVLDSNNDGTLILSEVQPTFAVLSHTAGATLEEDTYVGAYDLDTNGLVESTDLVSFADTYVSAVEANVAPIAATPTEPSVSPEAALPSVVGTPVPSSTPIPTPLPSNTHQLFATSIGFPANSREMLFTHPRFTDRYVPTTSGFEAASQACNLLAADAGLQDSASDNNWIALLSRPELPIKEFLTGPVYNVRGELISQSADDLWRGTANYDRVLTEDGIEPVGNNKVWTGAEIEGGAHPTQNCALWNAYDSNAATSGRYGLVNGPFTQWYNAGFQGCDTYARYYCASGHSIKPSLSLFNDVAEQDAVTEPFEVVGLSSGVTDLDAGLTNSCAVKNGAALCWGNNNYGQLGNDSFTASSVPVQVVGLTSGVSKIATSGYHSCAIVNGGVKCWGWNLARQLGNETVTTPASRVPVAVGGLESGVTDIVVGDSHTCALQQGVIKCWGANMEGQLGVTQKFGKLGNRMDEYSATPVVVEGIDVDAHVPDQRSYPQIISMSAAGSHTCAMTGNPGSVVTKCWGQRYAGHEGGLVRPSAIGPTTAISAGGQTNGAVAAIATGLYTNSISKLAAGNQYSNQSVFTSDWGKLDAHEYNFRQVDFAFAKGQPFGNNFGARQASAGWPQFVAQNPQFLNGGNNNVILSQLDAGADHVCGVGDDGHVYCWATYLTGDSYGQLGGRHPSDLTFLADGSVETDLTPLTIATRLAVRSRGIASASLVAAGGQHTCAIVSAGAVKCWGSNTQGQIGNGRDVPLPPAPPIVPQVPATPVSFTVPAEIQHRSDSITRSSVPVQDIAISSEFNCGLVNTTLKCWINHTASNANTAIKHPQNTAISEYSIPTTFLAVGRGGSDVTDVDFNVRNACVVQQGVVKCWGENSAGQLGVPEETLNQPLYAYRETVTVSGLPSGVTQVVTGGFSCALADGSVYCWGGNGTGALGDGTRTSRHQPRLVPGLTGVAAIERGSLGMCAIKDGALWCWGQLMPGFNTPRNASSLLTAGALSPTLVPGFESGVTKVSSSWRSTCVVQNGALKCWGDNSFGQLGIAGDSSSTPVTPPGLESGVTDVIAGTTTCAVKNGAVLCWGMANRGVLGDGVTDREMVSVPGVNFSVSMRATPGAVTGLDTGVTAIDGAGDDSLGRICVVQSGVAKCWGSNRTSAGDNSFFRFGGLGFGIWTDDKANYNVEYSPVPVEVWL